jgi:hypothetical protein
MNEFVSISNDKESKKSIELLRLKSTKTVICMQ